jgi:xanthine dehydrogenase molybdenum-binding subunit
MVAPAKSPYRVIGTRPVRPDGTDKVTGRANYGSDIRLPGMLFGRVLRSPHAHARILRIDPSKALALPGVKAVLTHADFPTAEDAVADLGETTSNLKWLVDNVLASDRALYHGHAVAAVAATDPHVAEDALSLIEVEYEPLPPVLSVHEAMAEAAPRIHPNMHTVEMLARFSPGPRSEHDIPNVASHLRMEIGDLDAGFADAEVVLEREYETGTSHQGYIEPHNGTALWNEHGELTLWVSTQGPFMMRDQLSRILKLPVSKIRVVPMEIGGGFGGKIPVYMEPMAAVLSRKTGRPVKMIMQRDEVLFGTGPTSATYVRVKLGAKRDGTLTAAEAYLAYESGAYPGSPVGAGGMCMFAPYRVPNQRADCYDVIVNKPKVSAYRAPGAPAAAFAMESALDELAEQLDIDPLELRMRNAAVDGTRRIDGVAMESIGNEAVMTAAKESPHWNSELQGENRGRGIAMGFWTNGGLESSAYATVNRDGRVSLVLGSVDIGGQRAALAMQLAETLGIDYEQVKPIVVDTDSIGFTAVTGGSRTTFATGWAVHEAGLEIRRELEDRAALMWEVDRELVHYDDDGVLRGPEDRTLTFAAIAKQLHRTGGTVQGKADVTPEGVGPAFACHIVDVEVDPETAKVQVLRYTAIQDVGTAVHPDYVEGQIQGGAVQGVGMALSEEYVYDAEGHMRNASLLDYRMPTTLDVPQIDTILVEEPNPGHPYGVRGVGEVPIVPPLGAIASAIHQAIGVRPRALPASPRVLLEELLPDDEG